MFINDVRFVVGFGVRLDPNFKKIKKPSLLENMRGKMILKILKSEIVF